MTQAEFDTWAARHGAIFSMTRSEDFEMFNEWFVEFVKMGFTAVELHAATDHIVRDAAKVTRWDHLITIRDFIRARRRKSVGGPNKPIGGHDRGTCQDCGETGWACGLPHLSQLTEEGWMPLVDGRPPLTQAAVCTCLVGKWQNDFWASRTLEYKERYKRPMGLVEYTTLNPCWRAQLRELAERQARRQRSEGAALAADISAGSRARDVLKKCLADQWKMPKERP